MKIGVILYFISFFCLIVLACNSGKRKDTGRDIRGTWQAIANDTTYEEVIICDKDYYVYDERAGDLYFTYIVRNDSLILFSDRFPSFKRKLIFISENDFVVADSLFRIRFTRLREFVDTSRLMTLRNWRKTRSYDEEYYSEYVWALRERRYMWDSLRNASR